MPRSKPRRTQTDAQDKQQARKLALVLLTLLLVVGAALLLLLPSLAELVAVHLAPGLGLKEAALYAFFATALLLIVFAVAAGDGFLGEIQFMLLGFFVFFLVIWLLLAWVF